MSKIFPISHFFLDLRVPSRSFKRKAPLPKQTAAPLPILKTANAFSKPTDVRNATAIKARAYPILKRKTLPRASVRLASHNPRSSASSATQSAKCQHIVPRMFLTPNSQTYMLSCNRSRHP